MTRVSVHLAIRATLGAVSVLSGLTPAFAQGRGGSDWSTTGGDAHRSAWVRTDPKISAGSMKSGFQFMWKVKLQGGALTQPALMDRYIGYRGFRSYAFIGDNANKIFALDSDLSRLEWEKQFLVKAAPGTATCPGGMTASVVERVGSAFPVNNAGRGGGGGGRGGPARSGVGKAGEGAVTLAALANAAPPAARGPVLAAGPGGPGRGRMPSYLTVLTSDGALHQVYVSNGDEPNPPVRFLPPNANASGFAVVDDVAYAVTSGNCGGVPDGVWAIDLETKNVATWKGAAIGTAFGPDGTVYATTSAGELVALEAKTLNKKSAYSAGQPFVSHPVIFESDGKAMVAAATKDGAIHIVDGATLSKVAASAPATLAGNALATWQDASGTRWILHGRTASKFSSAGGLQTGWSATGSPASAAVVNGVVFLATHGSASAHASLSAVDAASGKELWSSGNTITSYMSPTGGLAVGGSTVYLGTHDGNIWAFGFPIEH